MNEKKEIATKYIEYLEKGDLENILDLFSEKAVVDSPVYGVMKAPDFYNKLMADTINSKLEILDIFESTNSNNLALYFKYHWTLINSEVVDFDVVDIIEFDEENKIQKLKIIYDTLFSRPQVRNLR